jgi:hypothetical protein
MMAVCVVARGVIDGVMLLKASVASTFGHAPKREPKYADDGDKAQHGTQSDF